MANQNIQETQQILSISNDDFGFIQDADDINPSSGFGKSKHFLVRQLQTFMKKEVGHVTINTGNGTKPTLNLSANVAQDFSYDVTGTGLGLSSFPTTTFPMMVSNPTTSDIYDPVNNTFPENLLPGQFHDWRLQLSYANKPNNQEARIITRIYNPSPSSSFDFPLENTISDAETSGNFGVIFKTIADILSLPAPFGTGTGYRFSVESNVSITITLESLVRESKVYDENATDRGFTP